VLNYDTDFGVVKHFYGFNFALGGIFSIRGSDFEKTNGFPNFWAWGGEDNLMHERAKNAGLIIDRNNFFTIGNMNILQFADGIKRLICRDELATSVMKDHMDGMTTLKNMNYVIYDETSMIDVTTFDTLISPYQLKFEEQTLDKVSRIRVSTKNAMNNIKELKTRYYLESNGVNYNPLNPAFNNQHPPPALFMGGNSAATAAATATPINPRSMVSAQAFNAINNVIKPNLPFSSNLQNRRPRDFVGFLPQQSHQSQQSQQPPLYESTAGANPAKVYQVNKQAQNVVIPLQRPVTSVAPNIHQQKRFGMRAMFM
jgi:hypothetical protein